MNVEPPITKSISKKQLLKESIDKRDSIARFKIGLTVMSFQELDESEMSFLKIPLIMKSLDDWLDFLNEQVEKGIDKS